jgi:hypothetical protein
MLGVWFLRRSSRFIDFGTRGLPLAESRRKRRRLPSALSLGVEPAGTRYLRVPMRRPAAVAESSVQRGSCKAAPFAGARVLRDRR